MKVKPKMCNKAVPKTQGTTFPFYPDKLKELHHCGK